SLSTTSAHWAVRLLAATDLTCRRLPRTALWLTRLIGRLVLFRLTLAEIITATWDRSFLVLCSPTTRFPLLPYSLVQKPAALQALPEGPAWHLVLAPRSLAMAEAIRGRLLVCLLRHWRLEVAMLRAVRPPALALAKYARAAIQYHRLEIQPRDHPGRRHLTIITTLVPASGTNPMRRLATTTRAPAGAV
ncbi:hypothetical protein GGI09_003458, partial [Coemansia sp. S100]